MTVIQPEAVTSTSPDSSSSGKGNTTDTSASVVQYGLPQNNFPLEDLEFHAEGNSPSAPQVATADGVSPKRGTLAFSGRKAMIVSIAVTVLVTLLTGVSMLLLAKNSPKTKQSGQTNVQTQDVTLKDAEIRALPNELQGANQSLLVNGDLVTRGNLKFSNSNFISVLKVENSTANQTYALPNSSGTICLDSNNCSYVTSNQLQVLQTQVATNAGSQGSGVTALNNQAGNITLQGSGGLTISGSGGSLNLNLPQDLTTSASPQFAGLTVAGTVNASSITSSGQITFFANGQSYILPTTGGPGQTICTTGITCTAGGGEAVALGPNVAGVSTAQQNASPINSSIFINNTGGANLLQLQSSGSDVFLVDSSGNVTATSFIGTGSGLTSLNASNISLGTLADNRLSANVALLDRLGQTFTGTNLFQNTSNSANAVQIKTSAGSGGVSLFNADTTTNSVSFGGSALFQNATDSTTAFQIKRSASSGGDALLSVSTSFIPSITVGGTGSAITNIQSGNGGISVQPAGTSGGAVTIQAGNYTGNTGGSVSINAGSGTTNGNINIGTTTANNISIGSTSLAGTLSLETGTGPINIGTATGSRTIQIGSSSSSSGTQTINIGNNNTSGGTTNITLGSGSSATGGTTTLQSKGGLNLGNSISSSIAIQPASGGTVGIANNNSGATINIGATGSSATTTTVHIADSTGNAAQAVTIGGTGSTSTTTLQAANATGTGVAITDNSTTSGTALQVTANGLNTGNGVNISTTRSFASAGELISGNVLNVNRTLTTGFNNPTYTTPQFDASCESNVTSGIATTTDCLSSLLLSKTTSGHGGRILLVFISTINSAGPTSVSYQRDGVTITNLSLLRGSYATGSGGGVSTFSFVYYKLLDSGLPISDANICASGDGHYCSIRSTAASGTWQTMNAVAYYNVVQSAPNSSGTATTTCTGGNSSCAATTTITPSSVNDYVLDYAGTGDSNSNYYNLYDPWNHYTLSNPSGTTTSEACSTTIFSPYCYSSDQNFGNRNVEGHLWLNKWSSGSNFINANTFGISISGFYISSNTGLNVMQVALTPISVPLTVTGSLATLQSSCSTPSGGCGSDNSNILTLSQLDTGNTGAVLSLQNSGTGLDILLGRGTIDTGTTSGNNISIGTQSFSHNVTVGSQTGTSALTLNAGTGTISIGTSASARTVNIATGAAAQTVTVGSTNTTSTLTLQAGSGNISVKSPKITFAEAADRTLDVQTRSTNAIGNNLTVKAGDAGSGASAFVGGNLVLQAGDAAGTGNAVGGSVIVRVGAKVGTSTEGAFDIQDSSGSPFFRARTSGGVGGGAAVTCGLFLTNTCTYTSGLVGTNSTSTHLNIVSQNTTTNGLATGNISINTGNASGTTANSGTITIGTGTATGTPGGVIVKNGTNSTTSFQIQDSAGTSNLFVADTSNTRIGIGTNTPSALLDVKYANFQETLINGGSIDITSTNAVVPIINVSQTNLGGSPLLSFNTNSANVLQVANDGAILSQNYADSTDAFKILRKTGNQRLFSVDTLNSTLSIGQLAPDPTVKLLIDTTLIGLKIHVSAGASKALVIQGDKVGVPTDMFTISNSGAVLSKNTADSTTAFEIQNTLGTALLSADTSGMILTVKTLVVNGTLSVNGHVISGNSSGTTTIGTPAGAACTTPTLNISGNDSSGKISITTGTGCGATGVLGTITFASAYASAPRVLLTPANASATTIQYFNGASNTTTFTLNTNTAPADATLYEYNYWVVQ